MYTLIAILLFSNHSLTSIREKCLYKKVFFSIFWQKTVLFISKNDYNFSKARYFKKIPNRAELTELTELGSVRLSTDSKYALLIYIVLGAGLKL